MLGAPNLFVRPDVKAMCHRLDNGPQALCISGVGPEAFTERGWTLMGRAWPRLWRLNGGGDSGAAAGWGSSAVPVEEK
jgi:hypothetical protein